MPALVPAGDEEAVEQVRPQAAGPARQVPLFDDRPKIIPFEALTRRKMSARRRDSGRREARAAAAKATEKAAQQPLDLRAPAPRHRTAISDDVPVAIPSARLHAAVLDAIFLGAGLAAAAGAYYALGGRFVLGARTLLPWGVTVGTLVMFYHLFWCLLGRESAGMRCLGLRTLTFDGHQLTWRQRVGRFVLACFSVSAVGIGALWALIDDESLTWHDHISKTFPTEYDPTPSTMRRQ